jgi:ubiquinone/menaquinone biosynthesis C-methylase UbiE
MKDRLSLLAYGAAQGLRVSWYFGQKLLAARLTPPTPVAAELRGRLPGTERVLRDLAALLQRDWRNIAAGHYLMPEDFRLDVAGALRRSRDFFTDLQQVEARRQARGHDEVRHLDDADGYPRYYLQNFHYQSDGYLSDASAARYDHQVEILFGGGAAAMRRQALVPLGAELRRRGASALDLIDLGCGTGRFLGEVKANFPRLRVTALELSPFYLAAARRHLSGRSGIDFVRGRAEAAPLPDSRFDLATAIYLFHELPPAIRRQVAAEIARLLRPGGLFVLVDSLQHGDAPDYDGLLAHFPAAFHEPYYGSYTREDLPTLFGAAGLVLESTETAYFSKICCFRKPDAEPEGRQRPQPGGRKKPVQNSLRGPRPGLAGGQ